MSYTNFYLSNARVDKDQAYTNDETIKVSIDVKNTGDMDGKEVVQLYVSKADSKVERAAQELKGFQKVMVSAGEKETVSIEIPVKDLAYYSIEDKNWVLEPGTYTLRIGNSSRNILDEVAVTIE